MTINFIRKHPWYSAVITGMWIAWAAVIYDPFFPLTKMAAYESYRYLFVEITPVEQTADGCLPFEKINPLTRSCDFPCLPVENRDQCHARYTKLHNNYKENRSEPTSIAAIFFLFTLIGIIFYITYSAWDLTIEFIQNARSNEIRPEPTEDEMRGFREAIEKYINVLYEFDIIQKVPNGSKRIIDRYFDDWGYEADVGFTSVLLGICGIIDDETTRISAKKIKPRIIYVAAKSDDPMEDHEGYLKDLDKITEGKLCIRDIKIEYPGEDDDIEIPKEVQKVGVSFLSGVVSFVMGDEEHARSCSFEYRSGIYGAKYLELNILIAVAGLALPLLEGKRLAYWAPDDNGFIVLLDDGKLDVFNEAIGADQYTAFEWLDSLDWNQPKEESG